MRLYAGLIDDVVVGWVSSIEVGGMTWCANMFVKANFRRFGIAKALMCKMLCDDRKYGSQLAVLTASHVVAMLYLIVGYSTLGTLYDLYHPEDVIFCLVASRVQGLLGRDSLSGRLWRRSR